MEAVGEVYEECRESFFEIFGRRPAPSVVPYRMDDAEIALVSLGTTASTVRRAVDEAREKGIAAGSLRVRMFRPFPEPALRDHLEGLRKVGILDRDISLGHGGVLWSEARACAPPNCVVQNYMLGLGGGDIRPVHIQEVLRDLVQRRESRAPQIMEVA